MKSLHHNDDYIDPHNIRIIDRSESQQEILPEPPPIVDLMPNDVAALVAGQLPDFLKPRRITLNEYIHRRLPFEAFLHEENNPQGDIATFSCIDEVIDESSGELFPIPLIESHNPENRITTLQGEETISLMKEDGAEVTGRPFYIYVDSLTRKGIKILVVTDDPSVALNVHDLFITFFDKSRVMTECMSYLLNQSVYHDILFIVDRGEFVVPIRRSQKR